MLAVRIIRNWNISDVIKSLRKMNHNKTRKKYFSISFSHIGLYLSRYLPKFCYARIFFLSKHVCCARIVIASNQIRAFDAALKPIRKRKKQKRHSACQFCRYFIIDEISNSLETLTFWISLMLNSFSDTSVRLVLRQQMPDASEIGEHFFANSRWSCKCPAFSFGCIQKHYSSI